MSATRVQHLLQDLHAACNSQRNQKKALRWAHSPLASKDLAIREAPPRAVLSRLGQLAGAEPEVPYSVDLQLAMYARLLNFSLSDYYRDVESFLECDLTVRLYHFEHLDDDAYLTPNIRLQYSVTPVLEISLYGMPLTFAPETTPWCEGGPIVLAENDIDTLPRPDFYAGGIMPKVHQWYRDARELVGDLPIAVDFPNWVFTPFCMALRLRGFEQLLIDMYERPAFVHRLLRRLTDDHLHWVEQRDQFLGLPAGKLAFANDDVGSPTLSTRLYEEFALPYEIELSHRRGGVSYWHSCNFTDPLLDSIKKIPNIQVFHAGPWNDVPLNVRAWCPQTGLEICMNPEQILSSSETEMQAQLSHLARWTRGMPATIRADCFDVRHDMQRDLGQIRLWAALARKTLGAAGLTPD